jgi:NAD(P)-dependent dehydrogenase (short-subunit alcohol dehydrogenase family)
VAEGAQVLVGDIDLDGIASAESDSNGALKGQRCDVSNESDVEQLIATAMRTFGGLDIAFANAGIRCFGPIVEADVQEWSRVVEVNLVGPLLTIKHASRHTGAGELDCVDGEPERRPACFGYERVLLLQGSTGDARSGRGDGIGAYGYPR